MTTSRRSNRRRTSGVTLVELVVAAALVGIVASGFAALYGTASSQLTTAMNGSAANGDATYVERHLTRTLRQTIQVVKSGQDLEDPTKRILEIRYETYDAAKTPPIVEMTGRYTWDSKTRTLTWNSETVSGHVTDFTIVDSHSTPPIVGTVGVSVTVVQGEGLRGQQQVTLHTSAQPRGLKWDVTTP